MLCPVDMDTLGNMLRTLQSLKARYRRNLILDISKVKWQDLDLGTLEKVSQVLHDAGVSIFTYDTYNRACWKEIKKKGGKK